VFDDNGVAVGVSSEGETAKAKMVVGSPEYFPQKVRNVGKVVRAIAFLVGVLNKRAELGFGKKHLAYIDAKGAWELEGVVFVAAFSH